MAVPAANVTQALQFQQFVKKFGRQYGSAAEEKMRFDIFRRNADFVETENAGNHTYTLEVNFLSDLTEEEKKFYRGYIARNTSKDPRQEALELDTSKAADSVDWTTKGAVTPVKNQGQCGSCWAFSTTGSTEGRYAIAKGKLTSLSEQELVDCSKSEGNQGCNGGLMDNAFEWVRKNGGLCTESDYPYEAKTSRCKSTKCKNVGQITGYKDLASGSMAQMYAAIQKGPVSIAIEADQSSFQQYSSGVLTGNCGSQLDHGVLLVGYGADEASGDFWKVKNSWGASWGEKGYIRLCRDCKKNKGNGQCGILAAASYPVV